MRALAAPAIREVKRKMNKNWRNMAVLAGAFLALAGCSDSSGGGGDGGDGGGGGAGGFGLEVQPKIEVTQAGTVLQNGSNILVPGGGEVGVEVKVASVNLINIGTGPLRVDRIAVEDVSPVGSFQVQASDGGALPTEDSPLEIQVQGSTESGPQSYWFDLMYTLPAGSVVPSGKIVVESNSLINQASRLEFDIVVQQGNPEMTVSPPQIQFGNVGLGEDANKTLNILNTGVDTLEITEFVLSGHESFTFIVGPDLYPVSPETASEGVVLPEPIVVEPGTSQTVAMKFAPEGPEAAEGTLILFSNDPNHVNGFVVPISGNQKGPCISVNPKKVDFGGKLIGKPATVEVEVLSCGESPLAISELRLAASSSTDFALDLGGLPGVEVGVGAVMDGDAPVVLDVNESASFTVTFLPDEINQPGEDGQPVPDLGIIHIVSDAFVKVLDLEVRGFGVEVECPTSVIIVQEGEEVIPQTKLHLIGSQSYAASGAIAKYEWQVQQPVGSQSVFLPSSAAPDPTFEVNVAGTYVFKLKVWDEQGEESCVAGEFTVFVNPDEAIHVELLWHTPSDPDETDEGPEAGADLDLHFLHPFATGEDVDGDGKLDGWFDQPFDCFWFNAHPNWGSLDPMIDDDASLDRDDTDGAGPENVNLNIPEDGLTYRVGVHYWNDHGFGPSQATIRVYIYSSLVFQLNDVELVNHDLWEVATIAWPSGEVDLTTDAGGNYKILPNYQHPFFPTPD